MKHFDSPEVTELLQFLAISMGILAQLFSSEKITGTCKFS